MGTKVLSHHHHHHASRRPLHRYALERRLFQQLLELKRVQIRNSRANEHVLIKRMVDGFQKEGTLLGLRGYAGPFNFNSYEKYLYGAWGGGGKVAGGVDDCLTARGVG